MTVPLAFFVAAWTYAFCVNFVPAYRNVADTFSATEIGITNAHAHDAENQIVHGAVDKASSPAHTEQIDSEKK